MISADAARNIIGITGNVISSGLFVTPAPMLWRICKAKDVEEFEPDGFLATLLSCMLWIFYGLPVVQPNNILVVTINGIGLVVEVVFLIIFFIYSTSNKRLKMLAVLGVEAAFMAALVAGVLHGAHTHEKRSMIVGILCVISSSFMYFPKITVTRKVIRDKSVEYMPFLLSLWTFLDGCCWMAYALIKFDLYVMIPHGLGAFGGLIQLFLYFFYYKSTPKKKNTELPTIIVDALLGQSWGVPYSSVYFLLGPCSSVVRRLRA